MMMILNLGAGVQSTTLFLMSHEGIILPIDHAIFADTQEEPQHVYEHLAWLELVPAPVPILHTATIGSLGEHLLTGKRKVRKDRLKQNGERFASIPAFTAEPHDKRAVLTGCDYGRVPRQCTKEYKTEVVEQVIRRTILGLRPRQRMPKGTMIEQIFGISADEKWRAHKIRARVEATGWAFASFPLIDMRMTRWDCSEWLKTRVPHTVQRSACVFCPFKSGIEWEHTKQNPHDWQRAIEIDRTLREGAVASRKLEKHLYVHRQCIPLEMVDVEAEAAKERVKKATPLFPDCDGGLCGV